MNQMSNINMQKMKNKFKKNKKILIKYNQVMLEFKNHMILNRNL